MLRYLNFNIIATLLLVLTGIEECAAQGLPVNNGDRMNYGIQIDIKNAYISGVCIMLRDQDMIKSSVVNEFGVSAIDFCYNPKKEKVKIIDVIGKLNKWYIKRMLKHDLQKLMSGLNTGSLSYKNERFNISYTLSAISE